MHAGDARERDRLERTLALIPPDARTGLEIGFNQLQMTRLLASKLELVSIDIPHPFPPNSAHKLVFASIEALPFADRAFDIVVCTEVLEHLPDPLRLHGINELKRVAKQYLLISVPYKQRVWNEYFKCTNCGFVGNTMGHLHHFDDQNLQQLFAGYGLKKKELIGNIIGYAPDFMYRAKNRLGNAWPTSDWECPSCYRMSAPVTANVLGKILERLIWRWEKVVPARPAWFSGLLQRESEEAAPSKRS